MDETVQTIQKQVAEQHETIIQFFRDIVAIPSTDSQLKSIGFGPGEEEWAHTMEEHI